MSVSAFYTVITPFYRSSAFASSTVRHRVSYTIRSETNLLLRALPFPGFYVPITPRHPSRINFAKSKSSGANSGLY